MIKQNACRSFVLVSFPNKSIDETLPLRKCPFITIAGLFILNLKTERKVYGMVKTCLVLLESEEEKWLGKMKNRLND